MSQTGAKFVTAALAPAYAKFRLPWFELLIGRDVMSWGPGRHGNLLLSANALPMDMFQIRSQHKHVGFQSFVASVEGGAKDKILSAHRLDLNLWSRFRLGIAESVLISSDAFQLRLLNPFSIYTVVEPSGLDTNQNSVKDSQGNLLISGDLEVQLWQNYSIYCELMVDDFQPRYGIQSHLNWASKFGVQLGTFVIDPFGIRNSDLRIEYAFINQFAYTHNRPINAYTHYDKVIGHEIGTDADDIWIQFQWWLSNSVIGVFNYELERHGEGNVNKFHPIDAPSSDRWDFLSGTTEVSHRLGTKAQYNVLGTNQIQLGYELSLVSNYQNTEKNNRAQHKVEMLSFFRF